VAVGKEFADPRPRYSQKRYGVENLAEGWKHSRIRVWSFRDAALRRRTLRIWRMREWKRCEVGARERRARVEKEERMMMRIWDY
jgi:hypothetical protein